MKKLLLITLLLPFFQLVQGQEELVKWNFPNNLLSDTVQNGTNALNMNSTLRIEGAGPVTMTNGATTKAATATNWNEGLDLKNWNISFITSGYDQVKISSKQSAGGTNGGPIDFKIQYKVGSTGTWADLQGGTVALANNWTTGVVANLELPTECQDQSDPVHIRWIMTSSTDINTGNVTTAGISKIDDIVVTGVLLTGIDRIGVKQLKAFPNPSVSSFSIFSPEGATLIEIYNNIGQQVYKIKPENEISTFDKIFPSGIYFIKATSKDKVQVIKHIIK